MTLASSPFNRFRIHSLLKWPLPLIILVIILTGEATKGSSLEVYRIVFFGFETDLIIGIWIYLQCRRNNISINQLVGNISNYHWKWGYISLAFPLFAFVSRHCVAESPA